MSPSDVERSFVELRCELRHLRGKLDVLIANGGGDGTRRMRRMVARCVACMDGYENGELYDMEAGGGDDAWLG